MKKQSTIQRYVSLSVLIVVMLLWAPFAFAGGSVEGKVQGLNCAVYGKVCPVDKKDPHVAGENTFVVLSSKKKYYFLSNIDRALMARWVTDKIRVTGELDPKYNAIKAKKIEVMSDGKYQVQWSQEMAERAMWRHYGRFGGTPPPNTW